MFGPRRFGELKANLPGISANVLTQRLEGLERAGIVRRRKLPPPANVQVYELTAWGLGGGAAISGARALGGALARARSDAAAVARVGDAVAPHDDRRGDRERAALTIALPASRAMRSSRTLADGELTIASRRGDGRRRAFARRSDDAGARSSTASGRSRTRRRRARCASTGDRGAGARFVDLFALPAKIALS